MDRWGRIINTKCLIVGNCLEKIKLRKNKVNCKEKRKNY